MSLQVNQRTSAQGVATSRAWLTSQCAYSEAASHCLEAMEALERASTQQQVGGVVMTLRMKH